MKSSDRHKFIEEICDDYTESIEVWASAAANAATGSSEVSYPYTEKLNGIINDFRKVVTAL